jgi:hypothetical protein
MTSNIEAAGGVKDDNLYSLEVGYAKDVDLVKVEGNPKGVWALPLDSAGDIDWTTVDDKWTPIGLEDAPIKTGTYGEISAEAMRINNQLGRGRGVTFFPHPVAKLAA